MMTLQTVAAPLAAQQSGSGLPFIFFLGIMVVLFYFFLLRPQRNRQRQQQALLRSVGTGARVMTTSGIYGTILAVEGDDVVLEIAPGVEVRLLKQAIMRIVEDQDVESDQDDAQYDDQGDEPADAAQDDQSAAGPEGTTKSSSKPSA
jgi:preprotein translocase subunit YajC